MTDKVQKIHEEVERLKSNLMYGACSLQVAMETRCKEEAFNEVLAILDSMQEEPVSEDLEEAIGQSFICHENRGDDFRSDKQIETAYRYGFETGAKWQKEQDQSTIELAEDHAMLAGMEKTKEEMMAKAVDGYVIEDIGKSNGDFLLSAGYLPKSMGLKDRQKVKVIVIKED